MAAITFLMSSLARLRVSARTERPDMARAAPQHRPPRTRRRTRPRARALRGPPARCAFCVTTPDTPRLLRLRRRTHPHSGYGNDALARRRCAAIFLGGKSGFMPP